MSGISGKVMEFWDGSWKSPGIWKLEQNVMGKSWNLTNWYHFSCKLAPLRDSFSKPKHHLKSYVNREVMEFHVFMEKSWKRHGI